MPRSQAHDRLRSGFLLFLSLALVGCGGSGGGSITRPDPNTTSRLRFLDATAGNGKVTLRWSPPADGSANSAKILRKESGYPASPTDGTLVYSGPDTLLEDSGLTNGTTYFYSAWPVLSVGDGGQVSALARPLPPPPAAPTGLTLTAGVHAVDTAWPTYTGNSDFEKLVLVYRTGSQPRRADEGTQILRYAGQNGALVSGLAPDVRVYFALFAQDRFGQTSAFTSAASGSALPLFEYIEAQLPAWEATNWYWPAQVAGDREFGGNGPRATIRLWYAFSGTSIRRQLFFDALEWSGSYSGGAAAGDGTRATSTWDLGAAAVIPAGWTFDRWLDPIDTQVGYVDESHAYDDVPLPPGGTMSFLRVIGDTDGNDIGATTSGDTHIKLLQTTSRRYLLRR